MTMILEDIMATAAAARGVRNIGRAKGPLTLVVMLAIWMMVIPCVTCGNYSGMSLVLKTSYMVEVTAELVALRFSIDTRSAPASPPEPGAKPTTSEILALPGGTDPLTVFNHLGLRYDGSAKLPSRPQSTSTTSPSPPTPSYQIPGPMASGPPLGNLSPQGGPIPMASILAPVLPGTNTSSPEVMGAPRMNVSSEAIGQVAVAAPVGSAPSLPNAAKPSMATKAVTIPMSTPSTLPAGISEPQSPISGATPSLSVPVTLGPLSQALPGGGRKLLQTTASLAPPSVATSVAAKGGSLALPSVAPVGTSASGVQSTPAEVSLASPSVAPVGTSASGVESMPVGGSLAFPSIAPAGTGVSVVQSMPAGGALASASVAAVGANASGVLPAPAGVLNPEAVQLAMTPQPTLFINFFHEQRDRTETMLCKNTSVSPNDPGNKECPYLEDANEEFFGIPEDREYLPAGAEPDLKSAASLQGMCWSTVPYESLGGVNIGVTPRGFPLPRPYYLTYAQRVIGIGFAIQYRLLYDLLGSSSSQVWEGMLDLPLKFSVSGSFPTKYVFAYNAFHSMNVAPAVEAGVAQVPNYEFTLALTDPQKVATSSQDQPMTTPVPAVASESLAPLSTPASEPAKASKSSASTLYPFRHVVLLLASLSVALSFLSL